MMMLNRLMKKAALNMSRFIMKQILQRLMKKETAGFGLLFQKVTNYPR
jgi:hypothetical protein